MKLIASLTTTTALFLFSSFSLNAGSLTINPGQPSFTPGGAFSNNTISAQVVGGNLVQIFGSTNIAITPNSSASISISGNFTADPNDFLSIFYAFGINLASNIPVSYTLSGSALNGTFTTMSSGTVLPGDHQYTGMNQTNANPLPFPVSGDYTGTLTFNFGGAPAGPFGINGVDSLTLSIPQNGLEFQVGQTAVPEPSTYALLLLGVGASVLVARRCRVA
jgi:hypothetical protein